VKCKIKDAVYHDTPEMLRSEEMRSRSDSVQMLVAVLHWIRSVEMSLHDL